METPSAASRFGMKSRRMTAVEGDWPPVRFGVIGDAWRLYRAHWKVWSLAVLIGIIGVGLAEAITSASLHVASRGVFGGLLNFERHVHGPPLLSVILGLMITGLFMGGMVRMALNQIRGRAPRVGDLFRVTDVWFELMLGSVLVGFLVSVGFDLLVVPGLVAGGVFMMTYPLIVDRDIPATAAMIQSFHALRSQWLPAALVHMAITIVAGLGTLFLGVGILITAPLYPLSLAVLYRDLFLGAPASPWDKPKGLSDEL